MSGPASESSRQSHPGLPPVILGLAGFAAAFALASCCALPVILSALGIGSAALAGVALVAAPHRTLLLAIGAACLGTAAVLSWRQRRTAALCAAGDLCSRPSVRRATALVLGLSVVLLVLGYLYV